MLVEEGKLESAGGSAVEIQHGWSAWCSVLRVSKGPAIAQGHRVVDHGVDRIETRIDISRKYELGERNVAGRPGRHGRDQEAARKLASGPGGHADAVSADEAAERADVLMFAVWLDAFQQLISEDGRGRYAGTGSGRTLQRRYLTGYPAQRPRPGPGSPVDR